ncbi:MAG: protein kinase [Pseudomonadota bacterium]
MSEKKVEDPILNSVVAGRYEVYAKLGEGGMGAVYAARQAPLGRTVALKVLLKQLSKDPIAIKRFEKEALAISRLAHPNTVTIFDFGTTDQGLMYIAMEFLEGRSLRDVIGNEAPLRPRRVVRILAQMVRALSEAHQRGVIHRDLKPDNIMLVPTAGEPDFVKVLDFGVAKLRAPEGGPAVKTLTQGDVIFGTPRYMSPEQVNGIMDDPRSDLYAVGAIAYEMLASVPVFDGDSAMTILIKQVQDPPRPFARLPRPIEVPEALEALVLRLLCKDREQRIQSADALLEALDELPVLGGGLRPASGRTETMVKPMLTPDATPRVGTELMGSNFARPPAPLPGGSGAETAALSPPATAPSPGAAELAATIPPSEGTAPVRRSPVAPAPATSTDDDVELPRRRGGLWLALAGGLVLVAAVTVWALSGDKAAPFPDDTSVAAPAQAALAIVVEPEGALITVDGELRGQAPQTVQVSTGRSHLIEATLAGYLPQSKQVAVEQATRVVLSLQAESRDVGPAPGERDAGATSPGVRPGTGARPVPGATKGKPDAAQATAEPQPQVTPEPKPEPNPEPKPEPKPKPEAKPKPKPGFEIDDSDFEKFDEFKPIE